MASVTVLLALLALVACAAGQDMTSMMLQVMGIEAPPLPPEMPSSLRQHLYPQETLQQQQRAALRRRQLLQQQQQLLAQREAMRQREMEPNPYSTSYTESTKSDPSSQNLVASPANAISSPGEGNSVGAKENPYTVVNPYSKSRQETSGVPGVRKAASDMRSKQMMQTMQAFSKIRALPKKIKDAKMAGCKLPVDSTAASVLMFNTCRLPAAQLVCQAEMMQCNTVGLAAMCCPMGMNNLAVDTISYMSKLEKYVADLA